MNDYSHRVEARIDRQIREAQERGDFDDLPGKGKPLSDHGQPLDPDWWLKSFIKRENIGAEVLPTTLALRREIENVHDTVASLPTEKEVREFVTELNTQIKKARIGPVDGPPVALPLVDTDEVVRAWREGREETRG